MLKKTITYTNFNEEEKTRELYFHLGKMDMARVHADPTFLQEMERAASENDKKTMLEKIEYIVRLAYGIRSEDGEKFIKTKEIQDEFIHSAVYEEFLIDLLVRGNFFEFVKGVFPPKVMKEIQDLAAKGKIQDPFAEPTVVNKSAAALNEEKVEEAPDDRPAWRRERRKPTRKELQEMSKDEMVFAFQTFPELISEKVSDTD
jgi:hypothetical protein